MAITINGSGTITGISAGGLPDNCVTAADLATTLDLSSNTVTLPSGTGGKILQVVSSTKTTSTQYNTGQTWTDLGINVNITPSSTNSKILVLWQIRATSNDRAYVVIDRGGTQLALPNYTGNRINATADSFYNNGDGYVVRGESGTYLDSPATTSSTTYALYGRTGSTSGMIRVNYSTGDGDGYNYGRTSSTITVMEVAA